MHPTPADIWILTSPLTVVIETKNRTLEETAALFDGDEAADQLVGVAAGAAIDKDGHSSGSLHDEKIEPKV